MFVVYSRAVPTTFVVDATRQQANARARFLARHYGKSFAVTPVECATCGSPNHVAASCDTATTYGEPHRDDYYVAEDGTWMLYEAVPSPADLLN